MVDIFDGLTLLIIALPKLCMWFSTTAFALKSSGHFLNKISCLFLKKNKTFTITCSTYCIYIM